MTVEVATYISDLDATLPPGTDPKGEGDNHLRLIKSVLKNTFPNVNGPVSATDEALSNASNIQAVADQSAIVYAIALG